VRKKVIEKVIENLKKEGYYDDFVDYILKKEKIKPHEDVLKKSASRGESLKEDEKVDSLDLKIKLLEKELDDKLEKRIESTMSKVLDLLEKKTKPLEEFLEKQKEEAVKSQIKSLESKIALLQREKLELSKEREKLEKELGELKPKALEYDKLKKRLEEIEKKIKEAEERTIDDIIKHLDECPSCYKNYKELLKYYGKKEPQLIRKLAKELGFRDY